MAAIQCKSCQAYISVRGASNCPKCGAQLAQDTLAGARAEAKSLHVPIIGAASVAIVALAFFFIFGNSGGSSERAENINLTSLGERHVRATLKDPGAAKFQNQFVSTKGAPCGEVNAKNSFGGYAGYKRYMAAGKDLTLIEGDSMQASEFENMWRDFCRQ